MIVVLKLENSFQIEHHPSLGMGLLFGCLALPAELRRPVLHRGEH